MHKNVSALWNTPQSDQDSVTVFSAFYREGSLEAVWQSHGNHGTEITGEFKVEINNRVSEGSTEPLQFQMLLENIIMF